MCVGRQLKMSPCSDPEVNNCLRNTPRMSLRPHHGLLLFFFVALVVAKEAQQSSSRLGSFAHSYLAPLFMSQDLGLLRPSTWRPIHVSLLLLPASATVGQSNHHDWQYVTSAQAISHSSNFWSPFAATAVSNAPLVFLLEPGPARGSA
jgi:hypothetical protein